jgi:NAD(P)-dependent dehydrogenase (short-subunit alcohol dehydrogenase family)
MAKTAIITGAARGIGKATATRFVKDGINVVIADILEDRARQTESELKAIDDSKVLFIKTDVADLESASNMINESIEHFGRIDILVNCAGISGPDAPVVDYPVDQWHRVLDVNLNGTFYCCKAVIPHMLKNGYGRIVNIASMAGKDGNPNMGAYSVSKAGVIALTKVLGKELAKTGIIVNCITPAVIDTEILGGLTQEAIDYMVSRIPMGRMGRAEEVAALIAWLASDECTFSTGAVFDISGGRATY